jgi:hypothetical protein
MKRVWHIAWNGLAVVSAIVFAASAILAVRSFFFQERLSRTVHAVGSGCVIRTTLIFYSSRGGIVLSREVLSNSDPAEVASPPSAVHNAPTVSYWQVDNFRRFDLGFLSLSAVPGWNGWWFHVYRRDAASGYFGHRSLSIAIPYWSVLLTSAVLPVYALVRFRRRFLAARAARRRALGQCVRCRYDLRATPGRCPECGTVQIILQ